MIRPKLEVADIFRLHGEAWRAANARHMSLMQRRVMAAIATCRTAELGGHVECCEDCAHTRIAYNSCRNRHCPKCQWRSAQTWLAAREAELLPVPYFHVVFRLPAALGPIALQNKRLVYDLLLRAAAQALITVASDRKRLGAKIGVTAILHTWGQELQHHPHVHCIVPGGGISSDGKDWVACKPRFVCATRQLSDLFRRLVLKGLTTAFETGELHFFGNLAELKEPNAFGTALAPLHTIDWEVYAKEAFDGPKRALAYLAQYTHRVAITNNRLIGLDQTHVSFLSKDYGDGLRTKVVRLEIAEFIRRFLLHVLPRGFQRIRHYGFLASGHRVEKLALCRSFLDVHSGSTDSNEDDHKDPATLECAPPPCPCCGGHMRTVETFEGASLRRHPGRILTSRATSS